MLLQVKKRLDGYLQDIFIGLIKIHSVTSKCTKKDVSKLIILDVLASFDLGVIILVDMENFIHGCG